MNNADNFEVGLGFKVPCLVSNRQLYRQLGMPLEARFYRSMGYIFFWQKLPRELFFVTRVQTFCSVKIGVYNKDSKQVVHMGTSCQVTRKTLTVIKPFNFNNPRGIKSCLFAQM